MFTSCYAWFGGAIAFNNGLKSYVADTSSPITRTSRWPKLKQDKVFKAPTERRSKLRELTDLRQTIETITELKTSFDNTDDGTDERVTVVTP